MNASSRRARALSARREPALSEAEGDLAWNEDARIFVFAGTIERANSLTAPQPQL